MTLRPSSIRGRLTLWYVTALAGLLALVEGILFYQFQETLYGNAESKLRTAALTVADSLKRTDPKGDLREVREALNGPVFKSQEVAGAVFDRQGRLVYGTLNAGDLEFIPGVRRQAWNIVGEEETARKIYSMSADGYIVEAALPWDPIEDSLEHLGVLLTVLFIAFTVVAGTGGWILVGAALRPIQEITDAANRIHADNLSEQLPVYASDREIRGLVTTLNTMMGRLAQAFDSHRRFTADASHELRTPITIVQNEAEVALSRARTPDEYRKILAGILEESKRMGRLVGDMLFLARNEALPETLEEVEVPLDDLCRLVEGEFQPRAEAKGLTLKLEQVREGLTVPGDPERLRRLLENLVDNALKYTPAPGEVRILLYTHNDWAVVVVEDTGPGIAEEHMPRLFERFYRVDKSRSRSLGGSGLGLSISQQLARLHGGSLTVESEPGKGSRFMAWLPRARQSADAGEESALSDSDPDAG